MAFNESEGERISLQEGAELTSNYRTAHPNETIAQFMGKDIINDILTQPGCVGIRIYYGLNNQGEKNIVLVGTDSQENDLTSGIIADRALPCPLNCSNPNPLNS